MRVFGWQTRVRNESEALEGVLCPRTRDRLPQRTIAFEHTCWDPKDGELCLDRMKPEETLVEVRRRSDVQIDGRIWV